MSRTIPFVILAAAFFMGAAAHAQSTFPLHPIKILTGFPAGSATDVAARALSGPMAQQLGQPVIIENRTGAASNIAAAAVAAAPADGYTVFVATIANTINAAFPGSHSVDLVSAFTPIMMIGSVPNVLVANPALHLRSLDDLIRLAKAQPGKLTYASSGIGTSPHLSGVLFSTLTGVQMSHVPYRGSTPAVTDLLSGQVQIMFSPASSVLQYIRAHRLDALAVTSARRASVLPDLPTIDELGLKGFETSVWYGLVVPVGTPREPIERIAMATRFSLASNEVQSLFKAQGIEIVDAGAEEFARYLRSEASKWSAVIREADIHPE